MTASTARIQDYGIIGDTTPLRWSAETARSTGSACRASIRRPASPSCWATTANGFWRIAPVPSAGPVNRVGRRYRDDTFILETEFEVAGGVVRLVDCMPLRESRRRVMRMVECTQGQVDMRMDLVMRFDYGSVVPWVRRSGPLLTAMAGPDALSLWASVEVRSEGLTTVLTSRSPKARRVLRAHLVRLSRAGSLAGQRRLRDRGHRVLVAGLGILFLRQG